MKKQPPKGIMIIDCNHRPSAPRSATIREHNGNGIINFDLNNMKAIPVSSKLKTGEAFINLEETIRRFGHNWKNKPADANVLDNIKKQLDGIPKKFNRPGIYLLFPATTYLKKGGKLCIRALNYAQNGWYETLLFDEDHFSNNDFVVCT